MERATGRAAFWAAMIMTCVCVAAWRAAPVGGQQPPAANLASNAAEPPAAEPPAVQAAPAPPAKETITAQEANLAFAALGVGIVVVLGLIIGARTNAFLALISAAMLVSVLAPGPAAEKISRVAIEFGKSAGNIGIVIGLAAIIGKCMLDSGAADRVVRAFLRLFGQQQAPLALMGSGFVLAVPVFFDTVFYLLVPLARSLHRRTGKEYLKYLLAIGAGGAITHTLVPPTPGPLTMANTLGFDVGLMIMIGLVVALPAALAGLLFATIADRLMPTPMRQVGAEPDPEPLPDSELPPLWLSLAPVLLPVLLISGNTICKTIFEKELRLAKQEVLAALPADQAALDVAAINQLALEAVPANLRRAYETMATLGDANLALLLSTVIALATVFIQRRLSLKELGALVETSLMTGGVIILITSAGGAFGAMLRAARVGDAIEAQFSGGASGLFLLGLSFGIGALLKIAQGSSTVAMVTGSGMLAAMIAPMLDPLTLPFHPVYLATALGAGSLVGSWMNDSGFWVFAKMGGLTEVEALKSWTIMLLVLATVSFLTTIVLASVWPFPFGILPTS